MDFRFKNKKITGILSMLPSKEIYFDDELEYYNFSESKATKLKLTMGYNKRRIFDKELCVSDICVHLSFIVLVRLFRFLVLMPPC